MKKKIVLLFAILICGFITQAQNHRIEIDLHAYPDTTFYLAQNTDDGFFIKDTARTNRDGQMIFEGKNTLDVGFYALLLHRKVIFTFLLVDQYFKIVADTGKANRNIRFIGSKESSLYNDFLKESNTRYNEVKVNNPAKVTQEMYLFAQNYLLKAQNTFAEKVIKANLSPLGFQMLNNLSTKQDSISFNKQFLQYYWDNIDFKDDRIASLPLFTTKWDKYFALIGSLKLDTLCSIADNLINRTQPTSEFRKKLIVRIANSFIGSKNLGLDSVYVHISEKHLINSTLFADSSTQKINKDLVASYKPNLVGKVLLDFTVADTLNKFYSLNAEKSPYLLVVFYDPNCHHCQEFVKELLKKQTELNQASMSVWLICNDHNHLEWKNYLRTLPPNTFVHGFDLSNRIDIRKKYNVQSLPTVYLLNKDKKILVNKKWKVVDYFQFVNK